MTKKELKNELEMTRESLIAKGFSWNKNKGIDWASIKRFEIAYQDTLERLYPHNCWWELTNYWDIFNAMMSGIDDKDIIDEIIAHIDDKYFGE